MNEFSINISEIEELQMTNNTNDLVRIFSKAKSVVVQGGSVFLIRKNADGSIYTFDKNYD